MNTTNQSLSVRDHVRQFQGEILKGNLTPTRTAELNDMAAALLGNAGEDLIAAEVIYKAKRAEWYRIEKSANRADVMAEATMEYRQLLEAKNLREEILELCRSLRKSLELHKAELWESHHAR